MNNQEASQSELFDATIYPDDILGSELAGKEPLHLVDATDEQVAIPPSTISSDSEISLTEYRARIQRLNAVGVKLVELVKSGEDKAMDNLWTHIGPLVLVFARKQASYLPIEERIQVAALRLTRYIAGYDPDRSSLSDFIFGHTTNAIKDEERRVSRSGGLTRSDFTRLRSVAEGDNQEEDLEQLVKEGFTYAPFLVQDGKVRQEPGSLEKLYDNPRGENKNLSVVPRSNDDTFEQAAANLEMVTLVKIIAKLPPDQQVVINHYYGINGYEQLSTAKIGQELLNVTASRVSQIHRAAVERIKALAKGESVTGFRNRLSSVKAEGRQELREDFLKRVGMHLDQLKISLLSEGEVEHFFKLFPEWNITKHHTTGSQKTTISRDVDMIATAMKLDVSEDVKFSLTQEGSKIIIATDDITLAELKRIIEIEKVINSLCIEQNNPQAQYKEMLILLTEREIEVVKKMFLVYGEIAHELKISPSTVRTHMRTARKAFDVKTQRELAVEVCNAGLIDLDAIPAKRTKQLTETEKDMLSAKYSPMTYRQIAESTGRSVNTVRTHFSNIYTKTGADDRTQAIFFAIRDGLIPLN